MVATPSMIAGDVRAVPTLLGVLHEREPEVGEVRRSYPPDHPRFRVAMSLFRFLLMTMPPAMVGLILGLGAWVEGRVSFREPRDERIARIVLTWAVVPAAYWTAMTFGLNAVASTLFKGEHLLLVPVPFTPFLLVGALGWRRAWRVEEAFREPRWEPTGSGRDPRR